MGGKTAKHTCRLSKRECPPGFWCNYSQTSSKFRFPSHVLHINCNLQNQIHYFPYIYIWKMYMENRSFCNLYATWVGFIFLWCIYLTPGLDENLILSVWDFETWNGNSHHGGKTIMSSLPTMGIPTLMIQNVTVKSGPLFQLELLLILLDRFPSGFMMKYLLLC